MYIPTHIHPYISKPRIVIGSRWRTDSSSYSSSRTPGTSLRALNPPNTHLLRALNPSNTNRQFRHSTTISKASFRHPSLPPIPRASCPFYGLSILSDYGNNWSRQEMALQIQEVAPTDSRGGPHQVQCVALCSAWHLVPFNIRIRCMLARYKRYRSQEYISTIKSGHCTKYMITRQDSRNGDNHKSSKSCWVPSDSMTR